MSINGQLENRFDLEAFIKESDLGENDELVCGFEVQHWRLIFKAIKHHDELVELASVLANEATHTVGEYHHATQRARALIKELSADEN